MRTIVYNNILKLIETNKPVQELTKTGIKHTLYGYRGQIILSTYSNDHKIELFIGDRLFASAKILHTLCDDQSAHLYQLYRIENALSGKPVAQIENTPTTVKRNMGATPLQTQILQNAWWKSTITNREMCSALGNQR